MRRYLIPILILLISTSPGFAQNVDTEESFKKRIAEDKKDYAAMTGLGVIYQQTGNRQGALRLFKKAISANPDYPVSHFFLGRLYYSMQKPNLAVKEFNIYRNSINNVTLSDEMLKKEHINNLGQISDILFQLKKYNDAKIVMEEIIKIDPKEQSAYYNMGVYYYIAEHNRPRAYQEFNKAIKIDPSSAISKKARYAIEFMRNNPDSRISPDFSFIEQEYR